jgi:hypothetical protein
MAAHDITPLRHRIQPTHTHTTHQLQLTTVLIPDTTDRIAQPAIARTATMPQSIPRIHRRRRRRRGRANDHRYHAAVSAVVTLSWTATPPPCASRHRTPTCDGFESANSMRPILVELLSVIGVRRRSTTRTSVRSGKQCCLSCAVAVCSGSHMKVDGDLIPPHASALQYPEVSFIWARNT